MKYKAADVAVGCLFVMGIWMAVAVHWAWGLLFGCSAVALLALVRGKGD